MSAGLRFFERYLTEERREALDVAALGWQRLGRQQMAQIKGLGPQLDTLLAAEPLPGAPHGLPWDWASPCVRARRSLVCLLIGGKAD